jgi:hypothetical protein
VDQNGKLIPEGRICWSEAPLEVVIQKPYAIALLPRFVEVTDCWEKICFFFLIMKEVVNLCSLYGLCYTDSLSSTTLSVDTNDCSSQCSSSLPKQ